MNKKEFLNQLAVELHKPVSRKFRRAKVITKGTDDVWACDLVDMGTYIDENEGYRYMVNIVDCFTRYAWSVKLKYKTGDAILNTFTNLTEKGRKPKRLWTDEGKEFLNKKFMTWLEENNIVIYHTYGEHKATMVERFNRTLKSIMWKRFTVEQNHRWIDMLDELLELYNNTKHSSIQMTPINASKKENETKLWNHLYMDSMNKGENIVRKFKLGDWVRVSKVKRIFEKGYTANWSQEIFKIIAVDIMEPPVYYLEDYNGESIKGCFYTEELQKLNYTIYFLLTKF